MVWETLTPPQIGFCKFLKRGVSVGSTLSNMVFGIDFLYTVAYCINVGFPRRLKGGNVCFCVNTGTRFLYIVIIQEKSIFYILWQWTQLVLQIYICSYIANHCLKDIFLKGHFVKLQNWMFHCMWLCTIYYYYYFSQFIFDMVGFLLLFKGTKLI